MFVVFNKYNNCYKKNLVHINNRFKEQNYFQRSLESRISIFRCLEICVSYKMFQRKTVQ